MAAEHLHGEEAIIQEYLAPLAAGFPGAFGLRDDCAAITPAPGHDIVVKTDPVAAGIHFFADDAPEDIGWKALAVNVSDLAAKAAVPRAYLMALSFPDAPTRDWMARFAAGLAQAQSTFGMHLIGGDTDRRPGPITISITVFGETPTGRMIRRGAARPGDHVYVTGTLGAAAMGLALRTSPERAMAWRITQAAAEASRARYLRPQPRLALRDALRAHATAAMDISDGLAKDLGRMSRASGCGAEIELARVPMDQTGAHAVAHDPDRWCDIVAAGDDYELLIAVAPGSAQAFEAAGLAAGRMASPAFGLTRIGAFTRDPAVTFRMASGRPLDLSRTGWDHF
ncbi:MAG: thiamine-phosphate kinase [Hyphomicrobiaceae bacterium]